MSATMRHIDFEVPNWGEFDGAPVVRPGYRDLVVANGPAAYWRLGEASGSVAADEMGTSDGSYIGGVGLGAEGALAYDADTSASMDGSSGYLSVPINAQISGLGLAGSLEVWVYLHSVSTYMNLVDCRTAGDNTVAYLLQLTPPGRSAGSLRFTAGIIGPGPYYDCNQVVVLIDPIIPANQWVHLVAVYAEADSRLYVDGADRTLSVSGTYGSLPIIIDNALRIGRHGTKNLGYINGRIDDVAIYGQALTAEQVATHYRAGVGQ